MKKIILILSVFISATAFAQKIDSIIVKGVYQNDTSQATKVFVISFISAGTNFYETSRTTAM